MNQSDLLLGALALAIVGVAIVSALLVARAQARLMRRVFHARLANEGNMPSRYEVWAEPLSQPGVDPNVIFEFRLNGQLLASSALAGREEQRRRPVHQPAAAPASLQADLSGPATGIGATLRDVADILGDLLPDAIGARLRGLDAQARAGQATLARVERNTARYRRLAQPLTNAVAQRASADAAQSDAAQFDAAQFDAAHAAVVRADAAQTPLVAPGQQVTLELTVRPAVRHRAHEVWFVVYSRALADPDAAPAETQASARFDSMSGFRFYAPFVMIVLVALGLIVLLFISARGL